MCGLASEEETLNHCLLKSSKLKINWQKVWSWWKVFPQNDISLPDIIGGKLVNLKKKGLGNMVYVIIPFGHYIWKWWNLILHASNDEEDLTRHEDIFASIQRLSMLRVGNGSLYNECE